MANIKFRKNSNYTAGQRIKLSGGAGGMSIRTVVAESSGGGGGDPGVAGLLTWLKADAGVVYSGEDIISWEDQSGNDRHWTVSVELGGFVLESEAQNGLPVITAPPFTNQSFSTPTFLSDGSPAEVFVVVKSYDDQRAVGWGQFGTSTSTRYTFFNQVRETFGYSTYTGFTKYDGSAGFSIYNVSAEPGELIIRADYPDGGSEPGLVVLKVLDALATTTWKSGTFLLFKSGLTPWWGSIGELLVYDRVLTSEDRTTVYNYLQSRWAVS